MSVYTQTWRWDAELGRFNFTIEVNDSNYHFKYTYAGDKKNLLEEYLAARKAIEKIISASFDSIIIEEI